MKLIFGFIARLTKNLIIRITKPLKKHIMFVSMSFAAFIISIGGAAFLFYSQMPVENNNIENNSPQTNAPVITTQ